jgi:hypothetical protein
MLMRVAETSGTTSGTFKIRRTEIVFMNTGEPMEFMTLEDRTRKYDATAFPTTRIVRRPPNTLKHSAGKVPRPMGQ